MQKHVNLVDFVKSFPTNIYLQNLASIQKRTSSVKFAHLAEKSGKGSISNLSTKVGTVGAGVGEGVGTVGLGVGVGVGLRTPVNNIEYFPPNFEGLVLGCIDADFCK